VEIDDDFLSEIRLWSKDRQLELFAVQQRLQAGGPDFRVIIVRLE
jgi:hypothetical protein